jgi:hypothetical protein
MSLLKKNSNLCLCCSLAIVTYVIFSLQDDDEESKDDGT